MKIDVVPLPSMLTDEHVRDRVVVVFDVLRATTTIATAIANGAKEIRVFDSIDAARAASEQFDGGKLLCGEVKALPPAGFDLGNSPGDYTPDLVRGKTIFLSTTNGTRAVVAARRAGLLLTGALVNARAVADALSACQRDVTLLCSGTDGEISPEDSIGAGAVLSYLAEEQRWEWSKEAQMAYLLFDMSTQNRHTTLAETQGGQNVINAGLHEDVRFAAQSHIFNIVPRCDGQTMTIRQMSLS